MWSSSYSAALRWTSRRRIPTMCDGDSGGLREGWSACGIHTKISGHDQMRTNAPESLRRSRGLGRALRTFPSGGRGRRRRRFLKRLRNVDLAKVIRYGQARRRKWRELRRTPHPSTVKTPVFIVGCNRSGTNMVCGAIGRSPHGWDYRERDFSLAFRSYYLRAGWIIEQLIRRTPAPIVSFGSILDSQFTDDLLARFEGAKALWVYRNYEDVANSCARMAWGHELTNFARWVAHGENERLGARGERISTETVQLFRDHYTDELTLEDAACLYWYMRNQLYFDLNLHEESRVLLVQYEDAVMNSEKAFRRVFDFLGFPYHPTVIADVSANSVGKHPRPMIDQAIGEVCGALISDLDACFAASAGVSFGGLSHVATGSGSAYG